MNMKVTTAGRAAILSVALDSIRQRLVGLLCDPQGEASIAGTLEDNRLIDAALADLQARALDVRMLGQPEEPETSEGTDPLDEALGAALEMLRGIPSHDPLHATFHDHLRTLLEIQAERLRYPRFVSYGVDFGRPDGDLTAFAWRAKDGAMKVSTQGPKLRPWPPATDPEPSDKQDAVAAAPTDATESEKDKCVIIFKTVPGDLPDSYSCYNLLRRVVANARTRNAATITAAGPRWSYVQQAIGLGATYSRQLCERFGFDPDEKV